MSGFLRNDSNKCWWWKKNSEGEEMLKILNLVFVCIQVMVMVWRVVFFFGELEERERCKKTVSGHWPAAYGGFQIGHKDSTVAIPHQDRAYLDLRLSCRRCRVASIWFFMLSRFGLFILSSTPQPHHLSFRNSTRPLAARVHTLDIFCCCCCCSIS